MTDYSSLTAVKSTVAADSIALKLSRHGSLHEWFAQQARETPQAVAVVCRDEKLSYAELNLRAERLARAIQSVMGGTRQPVGLCMERSVDLIVGVLGILKAGCAYVPLDPAYPHERLAIMQEEARLQIIVTQHHLRDRLPASAAQLLYLDEPLKQFSDAQDFDEECQPDDLAYVIFTSGSTGRPKGVQVTHRNVMRLFTATERWFHFSAQDVWTLFHSYAFDFSVWELWGALLYGGKLVIVPHEISRTPRAFHDLLRKEKVTVLNQTPSAFQQFVRVDETVEPNVLSLRWVIFGGEALSLPTLQPWFDRHGDSKPRLVNMYGITETTVHVTFRPLSLDDLKQPGESVIGWPIPDLRVHLLDEHLQPVPNGEVGEMYIAGDGVAKGYLNRSDLTAERFLPDHFSADPSARLYKSGDLARQLPEGDLAYLGRIDQQVKIRGFRIELLEIEAALARHPAIHSAVAVVRDDQAGDKRLIAYIVARARQSPAVNALRAYLKNQLPEYMIPSAFILLKELPLTAHGKVDRDALPIPECFRSQNIPTSQLPVTETQIQLQSIWEKLLQIHPIGVEESFFDLGGDSLLAMRMFLEIEQTFGRGLSPAVLLENGTIAELAAILDQPEQTDRSKTLVLLRKGGKRPAFFCVHPLGGQVLGYRTLANYLHPEQPFVGIQAPEINGDKPFDSIEEMGIHYATELCRWQTTGPFFLGGYSMGAMVAYETARRLTEMNREIAFLALIDDGPALCPWLPSTSSGWSPWRFLTNLPHWTRHQACHVGIRQLMRDLSRKLRVRARQLVGGRNKADANVEEVLDIARYGSDQLEIMQNQYKVLRKYVPGRYAGDISVFRARTQSFWGGPPADLGWSSLVSGNIQLAVVPGEHSSIVIEPDAKDLGEKLDRALHHAYLKAIDAFNQ